MKKSCKELKRIARGALAPNWSIVIVTYIVVQLIITIATMPFENILSAPYMRYLVDAYAEMGIDLGSYVDIGRMPSTTSIVLAIVAFIIISLASTILAAGQYKIHLSLLRNEKADLKQVFLEFKNRPDRYILANILQVLVVLGVVVVYALLVFLSAFLGSLSPVAGAIAMVITIVAYIVGLFYFLSKFSQAVFLLVDHPEMKVIESFKESSRLMKGNFGRYMYICFSFLPMSFLVSLTWGIGGLWINPYMYSVMVAFYMDVTGEFQRVEEESRRLDEEMGPVLSE